MRRLLLFFAIGVLFLSATRSNAEVTFTYNGGNLTITQTTAGEIEGAFAPNPQGPDNLPDGCNDYTQDEWAALPDPERKAWFDNQADISEAPESFDYSEYWANYKKNDYNGRLAWCQTAYASTAPDFYEGTDEEWAAEQDWQKNNWLTEHYVNGTETPDAFGWNDLTDDQKKEVKSGWNQYVAARAAAGAAAKQAIIDAFNDAIGDVTDLEKVDMANTTFNNYDDMDFKPWGSTLTEAVTSLNAPDDYTVGPNNFNNSNTNLTTITYNSGIVGKPFDNNNVTTVNIGPNVVAVADNAYMRGNVTTLNMDNATSLAIIGESAFLACPIQGTLIIGKAVEQIKKSAFEEVPIRTLKIPSNNNVIKSIEARAFLQNGGGNLKDVYVDTHRPIICDVDAFDLFNVDGQTQVESSGARTRLYYPIELYDWYVGLYKQEINNGNLVDQVHLITNRNRASNGWQRFISSGILMAPGTTWRTFSDNIPLIVPERENNVEVFLVDGYDVDNDAAILVKMDEGDYIPAGTGVLVHFPEVDSGKGSVLYFEPAMEDSGEPLLDDDGNPIVIQVPVTDEYGNPTGATQDYTPTRWDFISEAYNMEPYENQYHSGNKYKDQYDNYLVAINLSSEAAPIRIDNVEIENGKKTYRNYFFANIATLPTADGGVWVDQNEWAKWCAADYAGLAWGFVRAYSQTYRVSQKAYLHFPVGENFPGRTSGAIHTQATAGTDISAKQFPLAFVNREEFDITNFNNPFDVTSPEPTSIAGVQEISNGDNSFYTLQGVKVASPAKNGIYIYNGKKYIVK